MSRPVATALLAVIVSMLALPAAATQWKWREGDRIIYSDRPPPARIPERAILERPPGLQRGAVPPSPTGPSLVAPPPQPVASAPATDTTEPALEAKLRREAEEKAAKEKAEEARLAALRADNCLRARSQLKMLDDGVRVARTNDKGEREILDDKQRGEEQARIRAIIASDCK
ncbi:DUF4124 domain-containing protein [Piscinibacter sakaiensis]|uniref:DUF4124 domain-containing protein n=1 Tax=Piscinibacter sakaiensis TaxID=1547922 RepID=UPI003AADBB74